MKIKSHSESHLLELDDGSRWQIFPGDLHLSIGWLPDTELIVVEIQDSLCTYAPCQLGGWQSGAGNAGR
jgi:hypothetical protein